MANHPSRALGGSMDALLGWSACLWAVQSLGSAVALIQSCNDIAYTNHNGDSLLEVRTARCCDC